MSQPAKRQPIAPGNPWADLSAARPKLAPAEPADKLHALRVIASGLSGAPVPHYMRVWFQGCVERWAVATGSSLESVLGLKRGPGLPGPHRAHYFAARDEYIRHIARALDCTTPTERAHKIAAIIRAEEPAPSPWVAGKVRDLRERFPGDMPTSSRQFFDILEDPEEGPGLPPV